MVPIPPLLQNGMGGKRTFELWSSCPSIQLFHMLLPRTASCLSMKYLDDKSWSLDFFFFFFKGRKKHNRKTPETLLDEDKMLPLALEEVSTEGALQLCAEQPASSLPLHLLGPGYFRSEQFYQHELFGKTFQPYQFHHVQAYFMWNMNSLQME